MSFVYLMIYTIRYISMFCGEITPLVDHNTGMIDREWHSLLDEKEQYGHSVVFALL